jgi:Cytochrome C'
MAGIIDFSAHGVFTTATSEIPLTEDDWLAAGLASTNLIGSATLITSPGAGPNDAEWVANPEWQRWAKTFQQASIDTAIAVKRKNRSAFLGAANNLAGACQSCHEQFRITDRRGASEFASLKTDPDLAAYIRAWPSPEVSTQ